MAPLEDHRSFTNRHDGRVAMVLADGSTGIWTWTPRTRRLAWDDHFAAILGIGAPQAPLAEDFVAHVHPEDRDLVRASFRPLLLAAGQLERKLEFRIRRFDDDRERWITVRVRSFGSQSEPVEELIGTAEDVTEQKLYDIHLHMLLREITHRSKNLLAIIQAMARQTVKDSLTAEDFEQRLSLRLRGLAASHELLAAQDWHGAHLEELVKGQLSDLLDAYTGRIAMRGESIFLKPEAAQNIGLALNELATNATRFGALSNDEGRVEVGWTIDPGSADDRRLNVTWSEFGGPAVAPPRRQGFGRKVVERVAASALDGTVNLTFAPAGLQWSLRIPISFVLSGPPRGSEMPKMFSA